MRKSCEALEFFVIKSCSSGSFTLLQTSRRLFLFIYIKKLPNWWICTFPETEYPRLQYECLTLGRFKRDFDAEWLTPDADTRELRIAGRPLRLVRYLAVVLKCDGKKITRQNKQNWFQNLWNLVSVNHKFVGNVDGPLSYAF